MDTEDLGLETLARINSFRELEDNWYDSHRSIPPEVVDKAIALAQQVGAERLFPSPCDAGILLARLWKQYDASVFGREVEIYSDGAMTLVPDHAFEAEEEGHFEVEWDAGIADAWLSHDTRPPSEPYEGWARQKLEEWRTASSLRAWLSAPPKHARR